MDKCLQLVSSIAGLDQADVLDYHETVQGSKIWSLTDQRSIFQSVSSEILWFVNAESKRHRLDGPAVIRPDGKVEWWINGEQLEFDTWLELSTASDEQKIIFKLTYG